MTIRYLTSYVAAGYTLSHSFSALYIEPTGGIGGTGLLATFNTDIFNRGRINATNGHNGVSLTTGGYVANFAGATITSAFGQSVSSAVSVTGEAGFVHNLGYMSGYDGVILSAGGSVTNGSAARPNATIYAEGVAVGADTVSNYGTLIAAFGTAVIAQGANSRIVNGSALATHALMLGPQSGLITNATTQITNFGTIEGSAAFAVRATGGFIKNGTSNVASGLIIGDGGVETSAAATIVNFGSIEGETGYGVALNAGGAVYNGTGSAPGGFISGEIGVYAASGAIGNDGTIDGGFGGVRLKGAGTVTNGSGPERASLIEGAARGIECLNGGAVANYGTVLATGALGYGLKLFDSVFTNGAIHDADALVEGYQGVHLVGLGPAGATSVNLGEIVSTGAYNGIGAYLASGAFLVNGSATDAVASISGPVAALLNGATLDNFGVLSGSLYVDGPDSLVIVEAGSTFDGAITGSGTLELGSGVGTITASSVGAITVSGSMATTTFPGFQTLQIAAPASFALAGNMAVGAAEEVNDQGTLSVAATITSTGSFFVVGTLTGQGSLNLTGGKAAFDPGSSVTIAQISESGAATSLVVLAPSLTLSGALVQNGGTLTNLSGAVTSFTGVGDAFAGTLTGFGTIAFAGGTDAIDAGASLGMANWSISGGTTSIDTTLGFAGAFSDSATVSVASGDQFTLSGASSFSGAALVDGAGTLSAANAAIAALTVGGSASLIDTGTVVQNGAVTLGDASNAAARLTIGKGATWNIAGDVGIARGHSTKSKIVVSGILIKSAGTGITTISPKITDNGLVEAASGTLVLAGAVGGKGTMKIDAGATLEADGKTARTLTAMFSGAAATLALKAPTSFVATIAGLAMSDVIDVLRMAATGASVNGADQLTIVDGGVTVATLQLTGNYTGATFGVASDGHGGTNVTLLTTERAPPPAAPPPHAFVGAMAGLGARAGSAPTGPAHLDPPRPMLLAPRAQIA